MSTNKDLLIDAMASHTVLHFVISVLNDDQKERLKALADFASPAHDDADAPEEIKGYMKELRAKVKDIIEIGSTQS